MFFWFKRLLYNYVTHNNYSSQKWNEKEISIIHLHTFRFISLHFNSTARYFNGTISVFRLNTQFHFPLQQWAKSNQQYRFVLPSFSLHGNWWCFSIDAKTRWSVYRIVCICCHTFQCIFLNRTSRTNEKRNCFYSKGFFWCARMSLAYLKLKAIHLNWRISTVFDCEIFVALLKLYSIVNKNHAKTKWTCQLAATNKCTVQRPQIKKNTLSHFNSLLI